MKTFFQTFLALVATVFFGVGCGTINVGGGFTSHATVEHYYYQNPQPVYVLPVPGQVDKTVIHARRWGGDPDLPREEKIEILRTSIYDAELVEGHTYYNMQAERAAGNTGGRGPTGHRH